MNRTLSTPLPETTPRETTPPDATPSDAKLSLRLVSWRPLSLAALLAAACPAPAGAQEGTLRSVPEPHEFVTTQDDSLYSLTRSQEDIHGWELAREELARGDVTAAVERLHELLRRESGGVVAVGPDRFLALRHAVVLTLANLSPAQAAAYEDVVRREAGSLLDVPPGELRPEQLLALAERFPAAEAGRRARLRLGDLAMESGDGVDAARHYRSALEAAPIGSTLERRVRERLRCAAALVEPETLRGTGDTGGDDPVADVLAVLPAARDQESWLAFGGGGSGTRPMTDPIGRPTVQVDDRISAPGFDYGPASSFAMHAVGDLGTLFVTNGQFLQAWHPLRRDLAWASPSPLQDFGNGPGDYSNSINQSMVLAAATGGDVVVTALQVPDDSSTVRYQNAFTIMQRMPERRLFAFHRETGNLVWKHYDQQDGPLARRYRGRSSCGPPLVVGDTVYAPIHDRSGAIAFYLGAYDLHTGVEKWRRLICSSQQEVNMFGNARMEFAASPLCAHGGLIYGGSNLGVCYAVEQATGRLRWITAYEVIRMPQTQLHGQEYRPVFFQNSAPVVTGGVVCLTPLDSASALGIDCETGAVLWRLPHEVRVGGGHRVRWLFGAVGDEFLLGGTGVLAVQARPAGAAGGAAVVRQVRGSELGADDRGEVPRPAVSGRWIYLPTSTGVRVFDVDGRMAPHSGDLPVRSPGNLLLTGGAVVSLGSRSFEVLFDVRALRARAEARLEATPDDPAAILELCTLRAALAGEDEAGLPDVEALYRRGLELCVRQNMAVEHPLRATFQRRLFDIVLERAGRQRGAAAVATLRQAAGLAPDERDYLRAASALLEALAGDRDALLAELSTLLERAAGATWALPEADGPVPVRAYVLWRRARLAAEPAQQVLLWQQLLDHHADATIQRRNVGELAQHAIAALIERHGEEVYAEVEQRAAGELQRAGGDLQALRGVCTRFPHSRAAVTARTRLLDIAVAAGDLGTAVDLFAVAVRGDAESPPLIRRVLEAARLRGNFALARAMAARLQPHGALQSDWPDDAGADYAAVLERLLPQLATADRVPSRQVPAELVGELLDAPAGGRGRGHSLQLLRTIDEPGFVQPVDAPLYVRVDDELLAYDLGARPLAALFRHRTGSLVMDVHACGPTLIVPGLEQLVALDRRTGVVQWQLPPRTLTDCPGVACGVLIVTRGDTGEDQQLLGIEPLTGRTLFTRPLPPGSALPQLKMTPDGLLLMRAPAARDEVPTVDRIDPVTGRTVQSFALTGELRERIGLRDELLRSPLFANMFAVSQELLYLPIDGTLVDGPSTVVAVRADGSVAWSWQGTRGRHLTMSALRGDRLAVVESVTPGGSRVVVLDAGNGEVLRQVELGRDLTIENWSRGRAANPAPPALLCADLDPQGSDRRLTCIGIDEGWPLSQHSLGGPGWEVVVEPWLEPEVLVFGARPRQGPGALRLYALRPGDGTGALPDNGRYTRVPMESAESAVMTTVGPYTVLASDRRIYVLGDGSDTR